MTMVTAARNGSAGIGGCDERLVAAWLLTFALYEWLRLKGIALGSAAALGSFFQISVMELAELFFIGRMAMQWSSDRVVSLMSAGSLLAVSMLVMLVSSKPVLAASAILLVFLAVFVRKAAYLNVAIAASLFIFQYNPLPYLLSIHEVSSLIDAALLRFFLPALGFHIAGAGHVVYNVAANFGVDVSSFCSSTSVLLPAISGFVILVLGLRGKLVQDDFAAAAGLSFCTIIANEIRITLTTLSEPDYHYWHDGAGAAMFSAACAAMVFIFSYRSASRQTGELAQS